MKPYLEVQNKQETIFIEKSEKEPCVCGSNNVIRNGLLERQYKDVGNKILYITRARYKCNDCGRIFFATNKQIDTKNKRTTRLSNYLRTGIVSELRYGVLDDEEPENKEVVKTFPTVFKWSAKYPFKWVQNRSVKK